MPTTIKSVLERVVGTLSDDASITWTLQDLCRYGSDGQRDMHVYRPDLFNQNITHFLVPGVKQALPANGSKLIDIPANAAGTQGPVTRIQRAMLDAQVRGWRTHRGSLTIDHFMYDEREPTVFDVYPPALTGAAVLLDYAEIPADWPIPPANALLANLTGDINVPDLQATALHHYICFRCYAEGTESAQAALAAQFRNLFGADLGVELQSITAIAPGNRK